jgi:hypothetical protein
MAEMNLDDWPGWPGRKRSKGCCDDDSVLSRPPCVPPDWKIHVRRALEARELGRRLREGRQACGDTRISHPIILVRQDSNPAYVVTVAWQEG